MKQIELKVVPMTVLGNVSDFAYRDMLQVIMESPQDMSKGAGIDEVRKSIRVLDALEKADGVLRLEDSDYAYMMGKVRAAKFTSANRVFVDFVDDLEKATDGKEV